MLSLRPDREEPMIPFPQISPEIFSIQLFGIEFALRWYALAYLVGLLVGWRIVVALMRRPALWGDTPPMRPEQVEELLTWIVLGVVLGGRLGFVLFYEPAYYLANPAQIPVVWRGGMSFHGGLLGVFLASWWFSRRHGIRLLRLADALAVATPVGLGLGRIANFIKPELWGRPSDVPWAMVFPGAGPLARHPSQLYEAGLEGIVMMAVLAFFFWRTDARYKPGFLVGLASLIYGLSRFTVEFFREPDVQRQWVVDATGLSMGQWLTVPMIVIGLWLIATAKRRRQRVEPVAGPDAVA